MPHEELKGRVLDTVTFPVEAGKIREFARATLATSPIHEDAQSAAERGFDAVPAPPTFAVSVAHHRTVDEASALGLDLRRVLHGEAAWEFFKPVVAGDVLTAHREVADVIQREGGRGGRMTMIIIRTDFTTADGALAIRQSDTIIERAA
jgi:acyl dehydratase